MEAELFVRALGKAPLENPNRHFRQPCWLRDLGYPTTLSLCWNPSSAFMVDQMIDLDVHLFIRVLSIPIHALLHVS